MALLCACAYQPPKPPTGRVPPEDMVEVPYPPPPARVQVIPPQKDPQEVWVEGQWEWNGKAWKWQEGSWVVPPPNAYFTHWTTERKPDGRLMFARASWRDKNGRALGIGPGVCPVPSAPPAPAAPTAAVANR